MLPELSRAIHQVDRLLQQIAVTSSNSVGDDGPSVINNDELQVLDEASPTRDNFPWVAAQPDLDDSNSMDVSNDSSSLPDLLSPDSSEDSNIYIPTDYDVSEIIGEEIQENNDHVDVEEEAEVGAREEESRGRQYNRRHLETLAPLLDRLGRTLVDAAPQVAALASSLPDDVDDSRAPPIAAAEAVTEPHGNETENYENIEDVANSENDSDVPPLPGLLSILSRHERTNYSDPEAMQDPSSTGTDPDYLDFASGLVNTHRGQVRSGPRGSRSTNDELANVLGAYLAAASLGGLISGGDDDGLAGLSRLLRDRGSGGGGIDIHIHAVVASPGGGGGDGTGDFGPLGPGLPPTPLGGTTARNLFSSPRDRRSGRSLLRSLRSNGTESLTENAIGQDEETHGLFSELYGENPTPLDRNGTDGNSRSQSSGLSASSEPPSRVDVPSGLYTGRRSSRRLSNTSSATDQETSSERRSSGWSRFFRRRNRD